MPDVGDKPSSLLFMDGILYGAFHSEFMGYLAFSREYGTSWSRVGFYEPGKSLIPDRPSPWLKSTNSHFFTIAGSNESAIGYELNLGEIEMRLRQ